MLHIRKIAIAFLGLISHIPHKSWQWRIYSADRLDFKQVISSKIYLFIEATDLHSKNGISYMEC